MSLRAALTLNVDQRAVAVDFTLAPGQVRGLYGPSGIGKSTLLAVLAGQTTAAIQHGQVTCDDRPLAIRPANQRAARVSLMFQNPDLQFCTQTPRTELFFCLENQAVPAPEMAAKVDWALAFCGIRQLADQALVTLSGGEKQLVALACCVVLESRYLLLDEPFANLDRQTSQLLVAKLQQLQQQRQLGILVIDHQLGNTATWISDWYQFGQRAVTLTTRAALERQEERQRQELPPVRKNTPIQDYSLSANRPAAQPVLKWQDFSLTIGRRRLLFPDVALAGGQLIGITGRSGVGKSTFLKSLLGVVPHQGQLVLNGQLVHRCRRKLFRRTSWVLQNPQDQFIAVTVAGELMNGSATAATVAATLAKLQLTAKADLSPFLLSQGQQRRLAVACFLARPLAVLLVDEPTYGQDLANAWQLMQMLRDKAAQGTLVVVVSHDQNLLTTFADQVWDLNQYQEVADAPAKSDR